MIVNVTVPVREVEIYSNASCDAEFDRFVADLPTFSGNQTLIKLLDDSEQKDINYLKNITFSWITGNSNERIKVLAEQHSFFHSEYLEWFLIIELELFNDYGDERSFYEFVSDEYLKKLSFLLHLTYGTSMTFLPGAIYIDQVYSGRTIALLQHIEFAYEHVEKIGWPSMGRLTFNETLNWFEKHAITLYSRSESPANRALNAFSHLFSYGLFEKHSDYLFWCMLALEALYVEGDTGVNSQFRIKSQLVLGEPQQYKKLISKLYEYRSRLVHGDIDILPRFGFERRSKQDDEYWENVAFATAILIASIRQLIKNDLTRFTFSTKWVVT